MSYPDPSIRPCTAADFDAMYAVINAAATAYAGVIPSDRYGVPYMPAAELRDEIEAGVRFWGWHDPDGLSGVMGIQDVDDVTLIRHAYVRPDRQGAGIGGRLLAHLLSLPHQPLLVGTWADATWAVRFYERHGFRLVTREEKDRLLRRYWRIPGRQVETSVVLRLAEGRDASSAGLEQPVAPDADVVAGWPASADEARRWGGHAVSWPVDPAVLRAWHADPDVRPFVLREGAAPIAYGEVWVDDDEGEVELARVIVRPERRGHGVGRLVVRLLLDEAARTGLPRAFVRVTPENAAALACYRAAGFLPVRPGEQRDFNRGQPVEYVWLRRDLPAPDPADP